MLSCASAHSFSQRSTSGVTRMGGWLTGVTSRSSKCMMYLGSVKHPMSSYWIAKCDTSSANFLKNLTLAAADTLSPKGHRLKAR